MSEEAESIGLPAELLPSAFPLVPSAHNPFGGPGEVVVPQGQSAGANGPFQSDILREILKLESSQARPLREIALAPTEEERSAARARLEAIEAEIQSLRAQLQQIA